MIFLKTFDEVRDEQEEWFHQDLKVMQGQYQGR